MDELLPERLDTTSFQIEGSTIVPVARPSRVKNSPLDILDWVECFNSYTSIIATFHPHRARNLLAYMALIIRTAKRFGGKAWFHYDRAFCCEAEVNNLANSPINVDNLEMQLHGNPDRQKVNNYVVSGFREGFHIGFCPHAVKLKSAKSNCPSSTEHSVVIDNYLTTEIYAGRVSGPLKTPPFPTVQVSRFSVIPKKNKANAWHLILDLSFPLGHNVNASIDKNEFPVCYTKGDDAIRLITKLGRGALMAKIDIKHAYCIVPVHRDDYYLLCMKWRDHYFVEHALPFGFRSAPYIFNSLADLFKWILMNNYLVPELLHYLDDYLMLGPPASPVCARSLHGIQNAAKHIGIPLAPDIFEGPTMSLTFLGIELD